MEGLFRISVPIAIGIRFRIVLNAEVGMSNAECFDFGMF